MNAQPRTSKRTRSAPERHDPNSVAGSHSSKAEQAAYAKKQKLDAAKRIAANQALATLYNCPPKRAPAAAKPHAPSAEVGARAPSAAAPAAAPAAPAPVPAVAVAPAPPPPALTVDVSIANEEHAAVEEATLDQAAATINQAAQSPTAQVPAEFTAQQQAAIEEATRHHEQQLEAEAQQERDRIEQQKKERAERAAAAQAAAREAARAAAESEATQEAQAAAESGGAGGGAGGAAGGGAGGGGARGGGRTRVAAAAGARSARRAAGARARSGVRRRLFQRHEQAPAQDQGASQAVGQGAVPAQQAVGRGAGRGAPQGGREREPASQGGRDPGGARGAHLPPLPPGRPPPSGTAARAGAGGGGRRRRRRRRPDESGDEDDDDDDDDDDDAEADEGDANQLLAEETFLDSDDEDEAPPRARRGRGGGRGGGRGRARGALAAAPLPNGGDDDMPEITRDMTCKDVDDASPFRKGVIASKPWPPAHSADWFVDDPACERMHCTTKDGVHQRLLTLKQAKGSAQSGTRLGSKPTTSAGSLTTCKQYEKGFASILMIPGTGFSNLDDVHKWMVAFAMPPGAPSKRIAMADHLIACYYEGALGNRKMHPNGTTHKHFTNWMSGLLNWLGPFVGAQ